MSIGWLAIAFVSGTFFGLFVIGLCQAAGQDVPLPQSDRSNRVTGIPHDAENILCGDDSPDSRADIEVA